RRISSAGRSATRPPRGRNGTTGARSRVRIGGVREVVLYTRDGCSLCVTAKAVLLAVRRDRDFAFREVDIGSSGDLYDEHRYDIPVVEIDGRRAFKHRVDADAFRKLLS